MIFRTKRHSRGEMLNGHTGTQTNTPNYRNPRCACAPRDNYVYTHVLLSVSTLTVQSSMVAQMHPCTVAELHRCTVAQIHLDINFADLHHCTVEPLHGCTVDSCTLTPLYCCTIAPLHSCTIAIVQRCNGSPDYRPRAIKRRT